MTTSSKGVDSALYRQVLGHFPTGVAVVTASLGDRHVGSTIGSFTSVSLEPPLVLFCLSKSAVSWPTMADAGAFCVNVLGEDQEHLSRLFAAKEEHKFVGVGWHPSPNGSPVLDGALAWIDCTISDVHEGGDHWIVVGLVHDLAVSGEGGPLVFFRGGYGRFQV